jgi:hypothetical protein
MPKNPIQPGRSKDNGGTPTSNAAPAISNRELKLLEFDVTSRKHSAATHSNRERTRLFVLRSTQLDAQSGPNRKTKSLHAFPISNRKPDLLETPQLQQNKEPRVVLIDNFYMFSNSISSHRSGATRTREGIQRSAEIRTRIRQARRKREFAPLNFVWINRRPNRLFSKVYETVLISPCSD